MGVQPVFRLTTASGQSIQTTGPLASLDVAGTGIRLGGVTRTTWPTGTVTAVTGTAPVVSSGGTAPDISMAAATASVNGYMTSTYATKLDGITAGAADTTNDSWSGTGNITMTSGNVGIGTTGPNEKLHAVGDVKIVSDSDVTTSLGSGIIYTENTGGTLGLLIDTNEIQTVGDDLYLQNDNPRATHINNLIHVITAGNVGIGTTNPGAKLHIIGNLSIDGTIVDTVGATLSIGDGTDNIDFNVGKMYLAQVTGNVGIGTTAPTAKLHINGNIKADLNDVANTNALYATGTGAGAEIGYDIAELFDASEEVEPGDVLSIAENGNLKRSDKPYDFRVAGIVSNSPAILFEGSQLQIAPQPFEFQRGNKPPLALAGRVFVKVTTENGPIKPGDLLTTSARPGYAMLAKDYKPGTILGKALEPLNKGTAKIKVLVTLQ